MYSILLHLSFSNPSFIIDCIWFQETFQGPHEKPRRPLRAGPLFLCKINMINYVPIGGGTYILYFCHSWTWEKWLMFHINKTSAVATPSAVWNLVKRSVAHKHKHTQTHRLSLYKCLFIICDHHDVALKATNKETGLMMSSREKPWRFCTQ